MSRIYFYLDAKFKGMVAAWVPVMFQNFCLVKNHNIGNKSTTSDVKKNYAHISPEFLEF